MNAIITICGSTKYKDEILKVASKLTLKGIVVLCPLVFSHHDNIELFQEEIKILKEVHRRKIDISSAVLIMRKDNRIGDNTLEELEYAVNKGKIIMYYDID